jgi:hypothetical protein
MPIPDTLTRTSRKKRGSVSLDKGFDHRLFSYAAAASAAGVAALSLAQPCHAQIVYTNAHQFIDPNSHYSLDLNHDGIVDFTITNGRYSGSSGGPRRFFSQSLWVRGAGTNGVRGPYFANAFALPGGSVIESGDHFLSNALMDKCKGSNGGSNRSVSGSWVDAKELYLGFAFSIDGQVHYGWARLNSQVKTAKCTSSALLTGYAYETVPGKPIKAGQTVDEGKAPNIHVADEMSAMIGTLGKLALGIMPSAPPDSKEPDSKENEK